MAGSCGLRFDLRGNELRPLRQRPAASERGRAETTKTTSRHPLKSPELNPVENIWQFMRDNWLSNRVFKSYDDIVDHCCDAWNKLVDQPWRIMSIGLRQWAAGF